MKNKPVQKREVAIDVALHTTRRVVFYASNDAVTEFAEFGKLEAWQDTKEKYTLWVDARFDFNEVLEFIEGYG